MSAPVAVKLPPTPSAYDMRNEASLRQKLEALLSNMFKKNEELQPVRFVLPDTATGERYLVTVVSGALTLTLL